MALDLSATAKRILDKLGSRGFVKLVKLDSTYEPVSGVKSSTETVIDLSAASLPVPSELVDGERIKLTDKLIIMDNETAPDLSDIIRIEGKNYRIVSIEEVNHAGTVQIYKVVVSG